LKDTKRKVLGALMLIVLTAVCISNKKGSIEPGHILECKYQWMVEEGEAEGFVKKLSTVELPAMK